MGSFLTPLPFRACGLCAFGSGPQGDRKCEHPECTARREGVAVTIVRSPGGSCGPEARHLHMPSWGRA